MYKKDSLQSGIFLAGRKPVVEGVSYGIEFALHREDAKRLRKCIKQW